MIVLYQVFDRHTGKVVRSYLTRLLANRAVDRLDKAYGAYRYGAYRYGVRLIEG